MGFCTRRGISLAGRLAAILAVVAGPVMAGTLTNLTSYNATGSLGDFENYIETHDWNGTTFFLNTDTGVPLHWAESGRMASCRRP